MSREQTERATSGPADVRPTPPDRRPLRALYLGLASLVFPPAGLTALLSARRVLATTRDPRDRQRAVVAVILGCISMCVCIAALVAMHFGGTPHRGAQRPRTASARAAALSLPDHARGPARASALTSAPPTATDVGRVEVARVGPAIRSLREELGRQSEEASKSHHRLVVVVTVVDCEPCDAFTDALGSDPMQEALAGTRFVLVSADHFAVELARIGIPVNAFPGFARIGDEGRVLDYIDGGEWDADIPENIAPVLESFVEGTYRSRRDPWRPRHDDETPI